MTNTDYTYNIFGDDAPMGVSLSEYTQLITNIIRCEPGLQNAWVRAEISDFRIKGGHVYMELIERDNNSNTTRAKMRAMIWAQNAAWIASKFRDATNAELSNGIKVMVKGSATYHPVYGLSFTITDIDPSYTIGDLERLRREILQQLTKEGVAGYNRSLQFPEVPQRIAIISSDTAAGYGDFMKQINENKQGFRFYTKLFPALMQGEKTSSSIRAALATIEETIDFWDCVAIIRGGGATSDLRDFDNLELARAVAGYHLPIIVGIGHERDRNVLDDVACISMKTPTAVGAYLVENLANVYQQVLDSVAKIKSYAVDRLRGEERHLASITGGLPAICKDATTKARVALTRMQTALPAATAAIIASRKQRLSNAAAVVRVVSARNITDGNQRLERAVDGLKLAMKQIVAKEKDRLVSLYNIAQAYNPQKTLQRGYSITRINGHSIINAAEIKPGDIIETRFAQGTAVSEVATIKNNDNG